jgi:Nif-specific regulatory protein
VQTGDENPEDVQSGRSDSVLSTGISGLDCLIGGVIAGDNIVWEVDSGAPVDSFVSDFISACSSGNWPLIYVSTNRSPQTIINRYAHLLPPGRFVLVDGFSSGKGSNDTVFLDFFRPGAEGDPAAHAFRVEKPGNPLQFQETLARVEAAAGPEARYVFDSLTGMLDLWGNEESVLRFFGYHCPRLYNLRTVAYWMLEKAAHSASFLAKLRHITQVVIEVAVGAGARTLTIHKAAGRSPLEVGAHQHFDVVDERIRLTPESREGRELTLLTKMGDALSSALEPLVFFERTLQVLAAEIGMLRGTLSLHDKTANKLRIVAAHGLSATERARGLYAVGEGVTGHVVETGQPEIIPDLHKDPRFLNRTMARPSAPGEPTAFICVPVKVDGEIAGALSADRASAPLPVLEKDLRLLQTVAAIVSQVVKINRIIAMDKDELIARDERMMDELRKRYRLDNFVGRSDAIRNALAVAATAAQSRASILITGETGTGKELIANVVHYNSTRSGGPFVKVNCGALPETLLESELFGHVRGAFTGALQDRKGRFEVAHGGTLFLDEVAEMSSRLQVKLLRILQDGAFEPVGSDQTVRVDVRVVAATNRNLREEMRQGRFREDLFFRLNVIPIALPPLRERRMDIPPLVYSFLEKFNGANAKSVSRLSQDVLDLLLEYPWPGNVRELENCIERMVVMSPGETLSANLLPDEILSCRTERARRQSDASPDAEGLRRMVAAFCRDRGELARVREDLVRIVEETVITSAMQPGLNQRDLARKLGLSRMTLRKKMRQHGIQ